LDILFPKLKIDVAVNEIFLTSVIQS